MLHQCSIIFIHFYLSINHLAERFYHENEYFYFWIWKSILTKLKIYRYNLKIYKYNVLRVITTHRSGPLWSEGVSAGFHQDCGVNIWSAEPFERNLWFRNCGDFRWSLIFLFFYYFRWSVVCLYSFCWTVSSFAYSSSVTWNISGNFCLYHWILSSGRSYCRVIAFLSSSFYLWSIM